MLKHILTALTLVSLLGAAAVKESFPGEFAKPEQCASLGRAQRMNKTPLVLVEKGIPQFDIVIAAKPTNTARYAAQELQHHFFLATGKKVPILNAKKGTRPAIHIGDTPLSRRFGVTPDKMQGEHFVLARVGSDIIISGGDDAKASMRTILSIAGVPLGTLYGVYDFLERFLKVRWYFPGDKGMILPPCKELSVTRLFENGSPAFSTRTLYSSTLPKESGIPLKDQNAWKRRMRFGGNLLSPIANHGFQWVYKKYPKKYELYALQKDGKRKANSQMGVHVCFANPELLDLTVKEALAYFKKNPAVSSFRVMPGDGFGGWMCQCAGCQKMLKPEKGPRGSASDMVWGFVNKVADKVRAQAPGKLIKCCAYESYKLPPSFPLAPNVAVTICHGQVPHASLKEKEDLAKVLDLWQPTGAKLFVWEYWLTRYRRGSFGAPAVFPRHLQEMYAMKRGRIEGGVIELNSRASDGTSARGWGNWEFDIPGIFLAAKLMWNASFDMEAELDYFYKGFFGPAAETMREFYENMEDVWDNSRIKVDGKMVWNHNICWKKLYTPAFVDAQMKLLRKALKETASLQPYKWRMETMLRSYEDFERNSKLFRRKVPLNPSTLNVPRVTKAPLLDGKITDEEWGKAAVAGNFLDSYAVYPSLAKTEVRLLHDKKYLYLGIKALPDADSEVHFPDEVWGKRDPALWYCDSVECFFGSASGEYYQYILALGERVFDGHYSSRTKKLNSKWTSKIEMKTSRSGNIWFCEARIPLSELKFTPEITNGVFKVNFARNHFRRPKGGHKYHWEQTGWQPSFGAFGNSEKFGTMVLK